jgi:hypothetical protein
MVQNGDAFRAVAGIFEYDRTLRERAHYRDFLFGHVRQTAVVSLSTDLQHQSLFLYRLRYVRDIMLHPTVDDPGVSAINSMITFSASDIVVQVSLSLSLCLFSHSLTYWFICCDVSLTRRR